ncbi:UNVERIFIED_CONTAM: hypothetical protein FKN15_004251 [Acipenser sinensis]
MKFYVFDRIIIIHPGITFSSSSYFCILYSLRKIGFRMTYRGCLDAELYYVRDDVISHYALSFTLPVPSETNSLHFTWHAKSKGPLSASLPARVLCLHHFLPGSSVCITSCQGPLSASLPARVLCLHHFLPGSSVCITSCQGPLSASLPARVLCLHHFLPGSPDCLLPCIPSCQVFRVDLFCSGKVDAEVTLIIQLNLTVNNSKNITVLNFKRRKMCYKRLEQEVKVPQYPSSKNSSLPVFDGVNAAPTTSTRVFYISVGVCCAAIFLVAIVLAVLHLHSMKRVELDDSEFNLNSDKYYTSVSEFNLNSEQYYTSVSEFNLNSEQYYTSVSEFNLNSEQYYTSVSEFNLNSEQYYTSVSEFNLNSEQYYTSVSEFNLI